MQTNDTLSKKECLSGVICEVESCHYNNHSNHCTATQVVVGQHASLSEDDAVCATFKPCS